MPRLPGPENIPKRTARGGGGIPRVPAPVPTGIGELGETIFALGTELTAAEERVRKRNEGLARDRADIEAAEFGQKTIRDLQAAGDVANEEKIQEAKDTIEAEFGRIFEEHAFSDESREVLELRLDQRKNVFIDQLAGMHIAASLASQETSIQSRINAIVASDKPLHAQFSDLEDEINFLNLPPALARQSRNSGREQIAVSKILPLVETNPEEARALLDREDLAEVIGTAARTSLESKIGAVEDAVEIAKREAEAKLAAFRVLVGRDPKENERLDLAGITNVPEEAKDEFNRNLSRVIELERRGETETTEYKTLMQRIAKQTQQSDEGVFISFDPETNRITMAQGSAKQIAGLLTGQQALEQQARLDRLDTVIGVIDESLALLEERRSRAGITGAFKNFAQKVAGVAQDAAPQAIATAVRRSLTALPGIDEEMLDFFDPALPETEIYENTIALELAKLRLRAGGGGIRALKQAFQDAKDDVSIRGLFSSNEAITRLQAVRREFATEISKQQRRLGAPTAVSPSPEQGGAEIRLEEGATATNPSTGERKIFLGGRWLDIIGQEGDKLIVRDKQGNEYIQR